MGIARWGQEGNCDFKPSVSGGLRWKDVRVKL